MLIVDVTVYGTESFYFIFFMSPLEVERAITSMLWYGQTKSAGAKVFSSLNCSDRLWCSPSLPIKCFKL